MPISPLVLQRRHAELGRIRLGDQQPTTRRDGSAGTRPNKLTKFRFTSAHERHIRDLAALYGGQARPWKNGTRDEWEVYSEAQAIPVIVVRGGISQWLETWSAGGCTHRCDGETNVLTDEPCDPDDPLHQQAKPTTRLSVMLRDLGAMGVWRLESHGWNAAAELPGLVELAQHVADLVPATLMLSERISIKDGQTSKFVVPGLDLAVTPARLTEIIGGQQAAVTGGPERAALEAGTARNWLAEIAAATTVEALAVIGEAARAAGLSDSAVVQAFKDRNAALTQPPAEPVQGQGVDQPATSDDVDELWMACVTVAGRLGWTTEMVKNAYSQWTEGELVDDANARQLAEFRDYLKKQAVPA